MKNKKIKTIEKVAIVKIYKEKEGVVITIIPLFGKREKFKKLLKDFEIGFIEKNTKIRKGIKEIKSCKLVEISL